MVQQVLNRGSGTMGDGSGESLFSMTPKINDNFAEVYAATAALTAASTALAASTRTANYTLALTDAGTTVEMNLAGANTVTVPPNSSVAFPIGAVIEVAQIGAGTTTIAAGAGVTLRFPDTLALRKQWSTATLRKRATNEWHVNGDFA